MPFAPVNGIDLYYESHGEGPAVVFAHGAGGNHLSWWQQIPFFAKRFRCITFDHRAFGRSRRRRRRGRSSAAAAFHDDLRALLDHLGIDDVRIVAQSMGGRTAVGFALRNPGRCKAMVLAGTTGGAVDDERARDAGGAPRDARSASCRCCKRAVSPELQGARRRTWTSSTARSRRLNPPRPTRLPGADPGLSRQLGRAAGAGRVPDPVPRRRPRHRHAARDHRALPPRRAGLALRRHRRQRPLDLLRAAARLQRDGDGASWSRRCSERRRDAVTPGRADPTCCRRCP